MGNSANKFVSTYFPLVFVLELIVSLIPQKQKLVTNEKKSHVCRNDEDSRHLPPCVRGARLIDGIVSQSLAVWIARRRKWIQLIEAITDGK